MDYSQAKPLSLMPVWCWASMVPVLYRYRVTLCGEGGLSHTAVPSKHKVQCRCYVRLEHVERLTLQLRLCRIVNEFERSNDNRAFSCIQYSSSSSSCYIMNELGRASNNCGVYSKARLLMSFCRGDDNAQQTRYIQPMLVLCRASVADGGPT